MYFDSLLITFGIHQSIFKLPLGIMHLFYQPESSSSQFDEEESKHIFKVLRLKDQDEIQVTNGRGLLHRCAIQINGKRVSYRIIETKEIARRQNKICMAVAPTRKAERNEWMVEKMTEIGVDEIAFIVTENTISEGINRIVNLTRLNRIAIAAMKQSQQYYLPNIILYSSFESFLKEQCYETKLMAYVPDHKAAKHVFSMVNSKESIVLLIGPEGDFTTEKVEFAVGEGFQTASLGPTRLRTETAAVVGCHAINLALQIN